jgi:hypothetical protein
LAYETVIPMRPAGESGGKRGPFSELIELVVQPAKSVWLVEIVLDTGQRYQSEDLCGRAVAQRELEDMRSRAMVVAVTMIELTTGEAITRPSRNLAAGVHARCDRELLDEALGGPVS